MLNLVIRRHTNFLRRQSWRNICNESFGNVTLSKIWRVVRVLSGDRGPTRPFACMALALRKALEETGAIFAETHASDSTDSSVSSATITTCILDEPLTIVELRAALKTPAPA